jgi:hypothetical protein
MSSNLKTERKGSSVPLTHAPRPQGLSWRRCAETYVINFLTLLITIHLKDIFFKSDNFLLQCGIYASFLTLFNFLYRKLQSLPSI